MIEITCPNCEYKFTIRAKGLENKIKKLETEIRELKRVKNKPSVDMPDFLKDAFRGKI